MGDWKVKEDLIFCVECVYLNWCSEMTKVVILCPKNLRTHPEYSKCFISHWYLNSKTFNNPNRQKVNPAVYIQQLIQSVYC